MSNYFDLAAFNAETGDTEEKVEEGKSYVIFKKVVRGIIISSCTFYCMYLLYARAEYYVQYDTTVSVKVSFMKELRNILPGITLCSGSMMSLKSLTQVNPKLKATLKEIEAKNMSYDEEYIQKYRVISEGIKENFDPLPLPQYFEKSKKLATSKNLISSILCDRQTWKLPGKFSRPSLPDICENIYKTRTIDKENGACFTLFHEAGLISMKDHGTLFDRIGRDEIYTRDPAEAQMYALGFYSPPMFPGNGLLTLKINYNLESPRDGSNQSTKLDEPFRGKFWIHSNRIIPKMSTTGYQLFPGKHYTIYLTKSIEHLMEPPYVTKCRNYSREYREKLPSGVLMDLAIPMSRTACIDECISRMSIENTTHCGCWPPVIPFRKDNQTEKMKSVKWCDNQKEELCYTFFETDCRNQCPADCIEEHYDVVIKDEPHPTRLYMDYLFDSIPERMWKYKIYNTMNLYHPETIIDIVFSSNEETFHDHSAALDILDFVVNMAGLFGLFLSLSAVHLIDSYEYLRDKIRERTKINIRS